MEDHGSKLWIRGGLCLVAAVLLVASELGPSPDLRGGGPGTSPTPPAVSAGPPTTQAPAVDLDRLYDLDYLVLAGDPPPLDLGPALVLDRRPWGRGPAVPEPGAGVLWILAVTALYTLYLPARSW